MAREASASRALGCVPGGGFAGPPGEAGKSREKLAWPGVRLALSEQELDELGAHLGQAKRLAPTRPHPNMPPTPEVLKVAAPIAGATDRIRDVLGGRKGR